MSPEQQVTLEVEAVREAEPFLRRQYHDSGQGSLFDTVRRQILRHLWGRQQKPDSREPAASVAPLSRELGFHRDCAEHE